MVGIAVVDASSACAPIVGEDVLTACCDGSRVGTVHVGLVLGLPVVLGAHVYGVGNGEDGALGASVGVPDEMDDGLFAVGA